MAISIITSPDLYQPVYNPIYTQVSSTLTSEEAFSFLFDVYVNGTYVTRDRLLPRPGTTEAIYSPARVLESYVSYDLTHNIVDKTASTNCIDKYEIRFGEEYVKYWTFLDTQYDSFSASSYTVLQGSIGITHSFVVNDYITVSDTVYGTFGGVHKVVNIPNNYTVVINKTFTVTPTNPGKATWSDRRKSEFITASYSGYVFNGVIQYEEVPEWDYTQYAIGTSGDILFNGGFTSSDGGWATVSNAYGATDTFLISSNQAVYTGDFDSNGLTLINNNTVLIPGETYDVTITTVTASSPYINNLECSINIGLPSKKILTHAQIYTPGTYTFSMVAGGTQASISVGTDAQGGSLTLDNMSIVQRSGSKFLTNQPYTVKTTLLDRGSIGFMNIRPLNANESVVLVIGGIDSFGGPTYPVVLPLYDTTVTTTNGRILEIPAYPWNLNEMTQASIYAIDAISAGNVSYTLQLYKYNSVLDTYVEISEKKNFELDHCGTRFEPVRFMFLNSLGQFDYYNATLLSRTTVAVSRDTYTKTLPINYVQGDRGNTIINVNAQENYTISTDWISEQTAHWLTYEFFTSNEIYVLDNTTGKITPIVLNIGDIEDKKRVNDKLLNYTITYSKAVTLNTRRN